MKKIKFILLLSFLTLFLTSCFKENHSVRVKNDYSENLTDISIGTANIGQVDSGSTSGYTSMKTGNFSISGHTVSGQTLSGTGSVTGKGTHKWTVTINYYGS